MNLSNVLDYLNNPKTATLLVLIFLLVFFLSEGFTTGFGDNFLTFGPTIDEDGEPTTFMGIKLSSWKHVIIIYTIVFLSTVLQSYYTNVIETNLHAYVWNPAVTIVSFSKFWSYLVLLIDPIVIMALYVITFYATATFQLQYIIPQFLGSYIVDLPFTIKWLNSKKFI
jgi:hypothetical protein